MIDYSNQKMYEILVESLKVYVCEQCIQGKHDSYGDNHLKSNTNCKNLGSVDGRIVQCMCTPEWPELLIAIRDLKHNSVVKRVQDHHRTIMERGDFSLARIDRVVSRYTTATSKCDILKVVDQIHDFLSEAGISNILRSDLISTAHKWFRPTTLKRILDAISRDKIDTVLSLVHK